jgi:hypothetical protein
MTRAVDECAQCGQSDDHPKVHLLGVTDFVDGQPVPGVISKHHDCLSANEERVLTDSPQQPGAVKVSAIIREAKGGRRGGELLEFITGDHKKADVAEGVQE